MGQVAVKTRSVLALALALALLASAGCGYFNALYNAQQRFTAAEQAERDGNREAAMMAYNEAIERAFVSFDKYPDSRWADDALLLIARARFARGETREAAAALERLLQQATDADVREQAHAYLGAARVRLGLGNALTPLDSAVAAAGNGSGFRSFSYLWRARARFAAGDTVGAWQDLSDADDGDPVRSAEARVESLTRAIAIGDSINWLRTLPTLIGESTPFRWNDTVRTLVQASAQRWSPRFVSAAIPEDAGERFVEAHRLRLRMLRADLLAAAGDTATAIDAALDVASASTTEVSSRARVTIARWLLASAHTQADMQRVRSILLPAFSWGEALQLIQRLRAIDVLIGRSSDSPVALFVAAELARDELRAPGLARTLFLEHASAGQQDVWSGKSLLAALDLSGTAGQRAEVQRLIGAAETNIYVQAARGTADALAFTEAETSLGRAGSALRAEAIALGVSGDLSVGRAVAVRDSIRLVLLRDSLATTCTAFISTAALKGIRADSTRAACLRDDTARVRVVMRMDTMLLRARRDSIPGALPAVNPDTVVTP